jgi:large subunit ribosomal protein L9
MKIILTSDISGLGKIGDIIAVANGYAKNFLIPSGKAISYTPANYKVFESKKAEFEQANLKNLDSASKAKAKIANKDLVIIENASDDGRLYGSVSSSLLAAKINEMLGEKLVSRTDIFLSKPIKDIGVYQVKLNLHSDISFEVRAIVTRSESEVESLIRGGKKNKDSNSEESAASAENSEEKKFDKTKRSRKKKEASTEE